MSEPVATLHPEEAYRLWAATYDQTENPLLALEERSLLPRLHSVRECDILDVGCGTGRWLRYMDALGAAALQGIDSSQEMLSVAKSCCPARAMLYHADASNLPVADASVDFVIASFVLSYVNSLQLFLKEIARVLRTGGVLLLSDLHPEARSRGWSSTFCFRNAVYVIETVAYTLAELRCGAARTGLRSEFCLEPCFGEPERRIFVQVGREDLFHAALGHPAIYIAAMRKDHDVLLKENSDGR